MDETVHRLSLILSERRSTVTTRKDEECNYACCVPSWCQRFRDIRIALVCICWCGFLQNTLTNGLISSVITTLERRYELTSKESGIIASTYDLGSIVLLIPVTYLSADSRKLRILSFGMITFSFGSFIFYVSHLLTDSYQLEAQMDPLCYRNGTMSYSSLCHRSENNKLTYYKYAFWIAHFIVGCGASPLYTLAMVYLDENLSAPDAAFYLGIFYTCSFIGPAVGFILGSYTLTFNVNLENEQQTLSKENSDVWVGAWWIGFVVLSIAALMPVIPLYGFPKQMPCSKVIRSQRKDETYGNSQETVSQIGSLINVKNLFLNVKVLLSNPTYMFMNVSGVVEAVITTGFSTFGAKFIQELFFKEASTSSRLMGLILIPSGSGGVLTSSFIMKKYKLAAKDILRMQFIVAILCVPTFLGFTLNCGSDIPNLGFAGISTPYSGIGSVAEINLTATCNADCKCSSESSLLDKVCGSNRLTYYSPCYAGCTTKSEIGYENCSCVFGNVSDDSTGRVRPNRCSYKCSNLKWFLMFFAINIFCLLFISVPTTAVTLRSVPAPQRSLALGMQWVIVRLFGCVVGPVIFGSLMDYSCAMWTKTCGVTGDCGFYDTHKISIILTVCGMAFKLLSAFMLFMAWFTYKRHDDDHEVNEKPNSKGTDTEPREEPPTNE